MICLALFETKEMKRRSYLAYLACAACVFLLAVPRLEAQETKSDTLVVSQDGKQKRHWEFTLDDVIVLAQSKSLPAMLAKYSFVKSYWQYRSYKAQFLPALNLGAELGQYNRSIVALQDAETGQVNYVQNDNMNNSLSLSIDQNIPFTGGTVSLVSSLNRFDQFSPYRDVIYNSNPMYVYYYQPIFQYNRLKWEKKTEPKRYEMSKRVYLEEMETIAVNATSYFFSVLKCQKNLEMARSRHESTKQLYEIAQERFEIGSYTKDELLQMELQVVNAEIAVSRAEVEMKQAMLTLRSYLGMEETDEFTLVAPPHFSNIVIDENDAVLRCLENTSFSLNNEINLIEAEAAIAKAKADRGFNVVLSAQFGLTQTGDNIPKAYNSPIDQEVVGLKLSIPIMDWGLGKGRVQMARSEQEIVITQIEQEIIKRRQDIYIRVVQFNAQSKRCDASRKADEIAAERFGQALQRFRNGTISILDINTARNEWDEASSQYIDELANYWNYYYNLRKDTLFDYIYGTDMNAEFDKLIE